METVSLWWLRAIFMILSFLEVVNCLPVTSKPLDNTPEHLAWEAWIMVPQLHNKTRKITPKSIFILPNKVASPIINCPPGHIVENSKCIQTVQIDSNAILLNHLANVLNNTNYDFDYDYNEFEESYSQLGEGSDGINDGPLKIDLLNPSAIENSGSGGENNYFNKADEYAGLQTKSTSDLDTVSPTISTTVINTDTFEAYNNSAGINTTRGSAELPANTAEADVNEKKYPEGTETLSSTTVEPIKKVQRPAFISDSTRANESLVLTSNTTIISDNSPMVVAADNYTLFRNVTSDNDEIITSSSNGNESAFIKADVTTKMDNATNKDFFLLTDGQIHPANETTYSQNDVNKENGRYTLKDQGQQKLSVLSFDGAKIVSSTNSSDILSANETVVLTQNTFNKTSVTEAVELNDENEPAKETEKDDNRFVYQHLPSQNPKVIVNAKIELDAVDNSAVNIDKRAKEGVKTDMPSVTQHYDPEKSVVYNFETSAVEVISSTTPTLYSHSKTDLPNTHKPGTVPTESSLTNAQYLPTEKSFTRQSTRPFWWLPSNWEVEKNVENPILIRFWSRTAATSSSVTSAPYLSRENSRRPTENLFREISPREFYKVLDAKNNNASNTSN